MRTQNGIQNGNVKITSIIESIYIQFVIIGVCLFNYKNLLKI